MHQAAPEVRAAARSAKDLICEWVLTNGNLTLNRPGFNWNGSDPLAPDHWTSYACTLLEKDTLYSADGKNNIRLNGQSNDTSRSRAFQIRAADETLEVKSFTVKPAKP